MKLRFCPLAAIMSAALAFPLAAAPLTPQGTCNVVEVWVDPVHGADPAPVPAGGHELQQYINNPILAFKTIQGAIDYTGKYLRDTYNSQSNPDRQAVVHLMPGIYGPATPSNGGVGNGETFPIRMHDRVHLRGVNARRCVIRGVNTNDLGFVTPIETFWAQDADCNVVGYAPKQVLIDCTVSSLVFRESYSTIPIILPWADDSLNNRTPEIIEGVTFQGGDVQVYFGAWRELPLPAYGRVSNCLFDMRDAIDVEQGPDLEGASIGLLVAQTWMDDENSAIPATGFGYLPHQVQSVGNTFLMAEFDQTQGGEPWLRCRPGAVGIVDTCDPLCGLPNTDPIQEPRGVNRLGIQNTLFRTHKGPPQSPGQEMAMVGVAAEDAFVDDGQAFRDTNAYAHARAGIASDAPGDPLQSFVSQTYRTGTTATGAVIYPFTPSDMWALFPADQLSTPPQSAAAKIWDGDLSAVGNQVDPAFVGEHLRTVTPVLPTYCDWRLLPGSPMQDKGWMATLGDDNAFMSGVSFSDPSYCPLLQAQAWDHEQFGNLRAVDNAPDIGFDEVQLCVMAGSYANHSLSHNRSAVLNPFAANEQATRFLFLRENAPVTGLPLQNRTLTLRSNEIVAGTNFRAWTNPPGSLTSPTQVTSPPAGYDFMYTATSNPVAWMNGFTMTVPMPAPWLNPQGAPQQPPMSLTQIQFPFDDEGAGFASWVNVQPVVAATGAAPLLGSMQPEFR